MKLLELLKGLDYNWVSVKGNPDITQIAYDSRQVVQGALFIAISGIKTDGHLYVPLAIEAGAKVIVVEREVVVPTGFPVVKVPDSRAMLALLASRFYGCPSRDLNVIAVTGTNGKTTTTHLIQTIHEEAGWPTAIMGTLYARAGEHRQELGHTTPEAPEIEGFMALSKRAGFKHLVMEVSSHALALNRVDQICFNIGVFTNLTQDHLDYHGSMNNYQQAKLKLFHLIDSAATNFGVINVDDPAAEAFIKACQGRYITYGIHSKAQVKAASVKMSLKGSTFKVRFGQYSFTVKTGLIGFFSVYNILAAIATALGEGISPRTIVTAIEKTNGIPGRFEKVASSRDFAVVVDYAHTPDGLENVLKTARELAGSRLITVFGCGGDRDRGKRPLMGEIASRYSDFCIVTSDNPRSEEPDKIIADIVPGLEKRADSRYAIIIDRAEAIRHAINLGRKGDLIIIAGKGHETYQLVKDKRLEFDDRRIAEKFLNEIVP